MKVTNRREFLKALGAASLLPALSKAAELSPEVKYRLGELGKLEIEKTVERRAICMWCSVGCGMIFHVKDNEVVDVEGDPDNPLNKGKLCVKGKASIAMFGDKNPLRLKNPMIRINPKPDYKKFLELKDADALYDYLKQYKPVWREVTWEEAFEYIARKWKEIIEKSGISAFHEYDGKVCDSKKGCYFYYGNEYPIMMMAGAKLLNEEGYIARKMAMLLGSNNIDHDARRCHSSTVAGLAATLGFGAQTQSFPDVGYIAVYLILGGNPADAHPVSMNPVIESKERGTLKLVVVDPKMGRTGAKANLFAFHRPGTDVALLYYILHHAFYEKGIDKLETFKEYIKRTNVDLEEINHFKELVKRYDAQEVSKITGIPVEKLRKIADLYVSNSGVMTNFKKFSSIEWAMGLTQHTTGTQNIRAAAIVQLALGNMGFPGGGLNPYRGHNNVQGTTDMCVLAHVFPGYIKIPTSSKQIRAYQEWKLQGFPDAFNWKPSEKTCKALGLSCNCEGDKCELKVNSGALLWSWWFMNWRRFELTMGTFVGTDPEERPWDENSAVISDLPFFPGYNEITYVKGTLIDNVLKGVLLFAENPAISDPNVRLTWAALSKMDLVVLADVFETETAWFTDVLLPGAIQYEKEGSITNSNRWIQWTDRVAIPPGDAKPDLWIMVKLYEYLRRKGVAQLPSERAGKLEERITLVHPKSKKRLILYKRKISPYMDYKDPSSTWEDYAEVSAKLVYREIDAAVDLYNGMYDWAHMYPLAKRRIAAPRQIGEVDGLLDSGALKHPNTRTPLRLYKDWGWSWPKNVRILYNLWTLEKTFNMEDSWEFPKGKYSVGESLDGKRVKITGETGEIVDSKTGTLRPAFVPGHNFFLGKFYKRAWTKYGKQMTDIFGGVDDPSKLIKEGRSLGLTALLTEDGFQVVPLSQLGVRYPVQESFYYDPEVVEMGKANFRRPYFKGTKNVGRKTIKYIGWREWKRYHDSFINAFSQCVGVNASNYRECVKRFIEKYGEWFAIGTNTVYAYALDYPMHFEPAESPSLELAKKYPQIAWRKPFNKLFLFPPSSVPELGKELALTIGELEREMPKDAKPIIITTNRLEEHWHTGALSRNNPYLAELVPEPFAEIPYELAQELGIKSGDIVEIGSARAKIYVRAMVTRRVPKLEIGEGETVYNVNVPWPFGYAGSHRTPSAANLLSPEVGDIVTSIQETKVFLGWLRKAPKSKYIFEREPELPNIKEEGWL